MAGKTIALNSEDKEKEITFEANEVCNVKGSDEHWSIGGMLDMSRSPRTSPSGVLSDLLVVAKHVAWLVAQVGTFRRRCSGFRASGFLLFVLSRRCSFWRPVVRNDWGRIPERVSPRSPCLNARNLTPTSTAGLITPACCEACEGS